MLPDANWCLAESLAYRCGKLSGSRRLGVKGVQIYAEGETAPENMDAAAIGNCAQRSGSNLVISAICADMGAGLCLPGAKRRAHERTRRIMDMALQLDCRVLTTHIGVVPTDAQHPRNNVIADALVARRMRSAQGGVAIETVRACMCCCACCDRSTTRPSASTWTRQPGHVTSGRSCAGGVYAQGSYCAHPCQGRRFEMGDPDVAYGMVPPAPDYNESDCCLRSLGTGRR